MVWNYHDDDNIEVAPADVELQINDLNAGQVLVTHYRVDQDHSNSYTLWKEMGSPQNPTEEQIKELERAGQLEMLTSPEWCKVKDGKVNLDFTLPRQGVSLVKLTW